MNEQLKVALEALQQGDAALAWAKCQPVLDAAPADFDSLNTLGTIALRAHQLERGVDLLAQAIRLNPHIARVHLNLGSGLHRLGRREQAIASYDRALALKPTMTEVFNNRGAAQQELGRHRDALADFDRAIAAKADDAGAWFNRAYVLWLLERYEEALTACEQTIVLAPRNIDARLTKGRIFRYMRRLPEALATLDALTADAPDFAAAHEERAGMLEDLGRTDEAIAACDRSIALDPANAAPRCRRAELLWAQGRLDEALAEFDWMLAIDGNYAFARGGRLNLKMRACAWDGLDTDIAQVAASAERGEKASRPFAVLCACSAPTVQLRCAETEAKEYIWGRMPPPPGPYPLHERIRVGYFGSIFCEHPTAFLIVESLEKHDAAKFEIIAFSHGPDHGGDIRSRLESACDRFIDVRNLSDTAIVDMARSLEIDIAVDLNGWTREARTRIFALRAAPIQVNYLGYPGTMGASYIDYLIADPVLIPEGDRAYYAEKIITLPDSYQPNDTKRPIAERTPNRAELGLPATGFVFVCFNNGFKITPEVFACWMRILHRVDGAALWLLQDNPTMERNLRQEARSHGIDPARLVFAPRAPIAEHLARQRAGDLFLDTIPYGAHTTASDALWAGLPVLTIRGPTFASRVAASLLTTSGLPELIAPSLTEYESQAISYATQRGRLSELREKLKKNRLTTPLFDIARYTRHLEAAYTEIYRRHCAGLPPDNVEITPART